MNADDTDRPARIIGVGGEAVPVSRIVSLLIGAYGQTAFGLVALLVIWYLIVRPELARNRLDWDKQQAVVEAFKTATATLERAVDKLERVSERNP